MKNIFVDMDGVLANIIDRILTLHNMQSLIASWPSGEYDLTKALGIPFYDLWQKIDHGDDEWFKIKPYQGAIEFFRILREKYNNVLILSRPRPAADSYSGKFKWVEKYIPEAVDDLVLAKNKDLFDPKNSILIDDYDKNCEAFESAGGTAILVPRPWNKKHELADEPNTNWHEILMKVEFLQRDNKYQKLAKEGLKNAKITGSQQKVQNDKES